LEAAAVRSHYIHPVNACTPLPSHTPSPRWQQPPQPAAPPQLHLHAASNNAWDGQYAHPPVSRPASVAVVASRSSVSETTIFTFFEDNIDCVLRALVYYIYTGFSGRSAAQSVSQSANSQQTTASQLRGRHLRLLLLAPGPCWPLPVCRPLSAPRVESTRFACGTVGC
jgi:hypothetical protein